MPQFAYDPPASGPAAGMLQTIRMTEAGRPAGVARWHAAADDSGDDGVVQLVDFSVAPEFRRRGYGRQLLAAVVDQARAYHRARGTTLRRMWVVLRHRRHVVARAFFLSQGFTHVATLK